MAERMRRTQILLPEELYQRLIRVARGRHRSLGSVVREALEAYEPRPSREERLAAVQRIAALQVEVPETWEEIEANIVAARAKGCCG